MILYHFYITFNWCICYPCLLCLQTWYFHCMCPDKKVGSWGGASIYIYIYKHHINIKFYVYSWKSSRPNKEWGFRMVHGSRGFPILPMGFRRLVQMDFLVEKLHMDEEQWSPSISRFHTKDHLILCKTMYILHRENIGSNWFLPFKRTRDDEIVC